MRGRRREAWAKWQALIAEQVDSGLSVVAFCQERLLTESQFFAWKRRLRQAAAESFVEAKVVGAPVLNRAIEIRLEGGRRVLVEPGFDAAHLRAVVEALEGQA